jgi:Zn-dependent peptidase ImmA (M78 family)
MKKAAKYNKAPTLNVTVRGLSWKIKFLTTKQMKRVYPDTILLGLTDPARQTIYVDHQQTQTTVLNTLFHELTHAWCATAQGSNESQEGAVSEEIAANCVGDGMVEFLPYLEEGLKLIQVLVKDQD